jgi:hypothetical protein
MSGATFAMGSEAIQGIHAKKNPIPPAAANHGAMRQKRSERFTGDV